KSAAPPPVKSKRQTRRLCRILFTLYSERSERLCSLQRAARATCLRKADLRRFPFRRIVDRKLFGGRKTGRTGEHGRREHLALVVVVHHGVVVSLARERDAVFGGGEFLRQLHHVLVGLEIRIRFADREQPAERLRQLVLAAGQLLHGVRIARRGLGSGQAIHRGRARSRDGFQRFALVRKVPFGGLDQIRNQVVAACKLHVDLRERVLVR